MKVCTGRDAAGLARGAHNCSLNGMRLTRRSASLITAEKIRVGRDFQAVCPDFVQSPDRRSYLMSDHALLVWSPTGAIEESKRE